jgi:hypothetical protein
MIERPTLYSKKGGAFLYLPFHLTRGCVGPAAQLFSVWARVERVRPWRWRRAGRGKRVVVDWVRAGGMKLTAVGAGRSVFLLSSMMGEHP